MDIRLGRAGGVDGRMDLRLGRAGGFDEIWLGCIVVVGVIFWAGAEEKVELLISGAWVRNTQMQQV